MQIGDIVKLIDNPTYDWMENYLDKEFLVVDVMVESVKLKIVGSDPEWFWLADKGNFEITNECLTNASEDAIV